MRSHREICTGQPCGCCRFCGEWRWSGATCLGCGRGPAGATQAAAPGADRPGTKKATSDLTSLFDVAPSDTTSPAKKGIDLI